MKKAILSLGTNIGDRQANIEKAIELLAGKFFIYKISPVYTSASLLRDEQQDYYNAVVIVRTEHDPVTLLHYCQDIETQMGRVRTSEQFSERIIDIDVLDYDNIVLNTSELTLPHPRMHERSFVLYPLQDADGEYYHPVLNITIDDMIIDIDDLLDIKLV